jgi:hypothetical protein
MARVFPEERCKRQAKTVANGRLQSNGGRCAGQRSSSRGSRRSANRRRFQVNSRRSFNIRRGQVFPRRLPSTFFPVPDKTGEQYEWFKCEVMVLNLRNASAGRVSAGEKSIHTIKPHMCTYVYKTPNGSSGRKGEGRINRCRDPASRFTRKTAYDVNSTRCPCR